MRDNSNIVSKDSWPNVLLNAVELLSEDYGYPDSWFPSRWQCLETDYGVLIQICTETGTPFLLGIVSDNTVPDSVRLLKQAFDEARICSSGAIIEGNKVTAYRYRSKDSELIAVEALDTYKILQFGAKPLVYTQPGDERSKRTIPIVPLTDSVESVFFDASSHIRDIDGLHADEALDELCKVLYTKLFDEEQTMPDEPLRAQFALYGNTSELSTSFREMYEAANEYDNRVYSLRIPGYKRSRGVFDDPIKLSAPALAQLVERLQAYDVSTTELDVKGRAFQKVFQPLLRAGMGQYFTPHNVVRFIVDVVAPNANQLILDPFCGSGHFLTEALDYVRLNQNGKAVDDFVYHKLHGIEKSERMVRVAMTDMRLHGDGHANIRCTDALLPFANYHDIERESFDLVLTNPPFGSVLGVDALGSLADFELAGSRKKIPLELLGLERSLAFLRPGGMLAIVLPESVFVNASAAFVRDWVATKAEVRAVVSLPIETFSPYGANIKTSILFCEKIQKMPMTKREVFCGVLENIGHDASGRRVDGSDCESLATEMREWLQLGR